MGLTASLLALGAVLLWSFLAYLGARLTLLPPLLVVAIALCISGLLSAARFQQWKVPIRTFAVGVGGIFGYHFLYFSAFKHAPAIEVNLMNYLWPLSIVLLSPLFLPGYKLQFHHLLGAVSGLAGAGLIITGGRLSLDLQNLDGYLLAGGAALTWACYSLMTKRLPPFPTEAIGGFCLASSILSFIVYFPTGRLFGYPLLNASQWLSLFLLGIGPMGAAFFLWDAALKRGDPRIIGSLAYLTPLTSTLILVLVAGKTLTLVSAFAMLLIIGGAVIGSWDLLRGPRPSVGQ